MNVGSTIRVAVCVMRAENGNTVAYTFCDHGGSSQNFDFAVKVKRDAGEIVKVVEVPVDQPAAPQRARTPRKRA